MNTSYQATAKDLRDISPRTVAQLLILNVHLYGKEKEKDVTRYRVSHDAICEVLQRREFTKEFEEEVIAEAYELGWHMVKHNRTDFALIQCDKADLWPKLNAKRLLTMIDVGAANGADLAAHIDDTFDSYVAYIERRRQEEIDRKATDL